ncbi:hypothetical protein [Deinococcus petrolearius]|uniref:Type II secretion system protein GspE N-terminal domain-containing protein n=1 Tax=Deinococcus petrolearius TaxID=1751295 RepID=A0ABW1DPC4_9DEIO
MRDLLDRAVPELAAQATASGYPLYLLSREANADAIWQALSEHAGVRLIQDAADIRFIRARANTLERTLETGCLWLSKNGAVSYDPAVVEDRSGADPATVYFLVSPQVWFRLFFLTFPQPQFGYAQAVAHLGLIRLQPEAQLPPLPPSLHREATLLAKGIPSLSPVDEPPTPDAFSLMPERLMRMHRVIPARVVERSLQLYMVEPENALTLSQVKKMTGLMVSPVMMTEEEMNGFWALQAEAQQPGPGPHVDLGAPVAVH